MLHCSILDPEFAFDMEQYKLDARLDDITAHANLMQSYTVVRSPPSPSGRHSREVGGGEKVVGVIGLQRALIDVDRRRIAYVLRNVLSNALNFTPAGGEVTVTLRLSRRMGPLKVASAQPPSVIGGLRGRGVRPGSFFGSFSSPSKASATIGNTQNSSDRNLDGPSELPFIGNADCSPVRFSRDSESESIVLPSDYIANPNLEGGWFCPSEEFSVASPTPGVRRDPVTPQTPYSTAVSEQDDGYDSSGCGWLRRKRNINSEKSKMSGKSPKKKGPSFLIVEVTDTGSGIAKENLDRIFKEIVQLNPDELHGGGHGGIGLGMVLSKGIVEAHGGKMWLTSEGLGKGCTFAFGLPLSRVQTHPDHKVREDNVLRPRSNHGSIFEGEESCSTLS